MTMAALGENETSAGNGRPLETTTTTRRDTVIKQLRCDLTKTEKTNKHAELVRVMDERDDLAIAFGEKKDDYKREDKRYDERIEALRRDLRTGTEERPVECNEMIDEARGTITVVRTDTHETIDSRAMTIEERQGGLNFDEDGDGEESEEG